MPTVPNPYRQHLVLLIALSGLAGVVAAGSLMMSLSIGGNLSAALIGLVGTIVGSAVSFGAVTFHDKRRQEQEIKAMEQVSMPRSSIAPHDAPTTISSRCYRTLRDQHAFPSAQPSGSNAINLVPVSVSTSSKAPVGNVLR
ncbi:putative membrane protein YeaQ/YmgE (transglycosylase-associated protein family) [Bradyrhizobium sp. USDA 4509]